MNANLSKPVAAAVRCTFAALALTAFSAASRAELPVFSVNPGAAGLNAANAAISADSFTFNTISTVNFTSATTFSETGFLSVQSLSFDGTTAATPGLNATNGYGLYIAFTGSGTMTQYGNNTSIGEFTSLNYTLYGYNGKTATFGFSGNTPTVSGITGSKIVLATGTGTGSVATVKNVPSADALVHVDYTAAGQKFFQSPLPFYTQAEASFTSTASSVRNFTGGFRITQGGGSFNFFTPAAPVPEPETYALMLAGLGGIWMMARRRCRH